MRECDGAFCFVLFAVRLGITSAHLQPIQLQNLNVNELEFGAEKLITSHTRQAKYMAARR